MSKLTHVSKGFETFTVGLSRFLIWVCAITLFVMMVTISLEVGLRYIFNTSLYWSFEVVEYMLVALTFLGLAYIQFQGKHIKVEFIFDRFRPRAKVLTSIITTIITLFLFIIVTIMGWYFAWEAWVENIKSWSITAIPQFPVRVLVPIGGFVMCLYLLIELFRNIAALQGKSEVSEEESARGIEME